MELNEHRRESKLRVAFPSAVLVAYVWVGVQILLLLFFRVALLYPTRPGTSFGELMSQVLAGSSAAGPALATGLFVVNLLFVGLIWLKYWSFRSRTRQETLAASLTCGGATILLLYLQWKWLELVRFAFQ